MLDLEVVAMAGEPLRLSATTPTGRRASVQSAEVLGPADSRPADLGLFQTQLGRLGGTIYELVDIEATIEGRPDGADEPAQPACAASWLPGSMSWPTAVPTRTIAPAPVLPALLRADHSSSAIASVNDRATSPRRSSYPFCVGSTEQIEAAVALGVSTIYADYQDIKQYAEAVAAVRRETRLANDLSGDPAHREARRSQPLRLSGQARGRRNPGAQRGGHEVLFRARHSVRGGLLAQRGQSAHRRALEEPRGRPGDGLVRPERRPAHAPDRHDAASWLEVVIHQQIPMFHMEHCVYCAFLSPGTDATNCGRPCDTHDVKLRDRVGKDHPLKADVGCRNTLYNAVPQTAAEYLPRLQKHGARFLRIEFLDDSPAAVERTITLYREVIAGEREGKSLWRS